ncbi:Proteasome subunit beta type-4 [Eufriesea mexicana]|uniref:Proteasome subunit beta n=1 Tax=Eufriesea mexicana TaxID=516756 RepID=A0A310SJ20_9HYME|nr:PREDICTED: proteasome subunit beta type-4 [Eufriesea mexicana]OAD55382.1 Proteasome subunit beta type-4 [Eufriesea mexicana]
MALFDKVGSHSPIPLWQNGPTPGAFYHFPGGSAYFDVGGFQRSQAPMTTGTSVIGIQFKDGVLIAADILGSYGSLARYRNLQRVMKVNDNIILGAGGDYADFQFLKSNIERKILQEECLDDGLSLKPKALHCWLTRVMYNRRSHFDPLWNNFIIGGLDGDKVFLGTVDKLGTAYSDPVIATGYGAYMATPILRKAYEENKEISKEEAVQLLYKVMQVLFYRDARSFPKYQLGIITKDEGVEIQGPLTLDSYWEAATM